MFYLGFITLFILLRARSSGSLLCAIPGRAGNSFPGALAAVRVRGGPGGSSCRSLWSRGPGPGSGSGSWGSGSPGSGGSLGLGIVPSGVSSVESSKKELKSLVQRTEMDQCQVVQCQVVQCLQIRVLDRQSVGVETFGELTYSYFCGW